MSHHLASGIIVLNARNNEILLVRDKYGWSLPKGSTESGESFLETAKRELLEETGLGINNVENVAFITEYKTKEYGQYLQVYYEVSLSDLGDLKNNDPDDVVEVKFVRFNEVKEYIKFRPWIVPLENWLNEKVLRYYSFDLDVEGFDI
ncbi:NUDIX hydrolase [Pullulanibacillus sp. KACC 23026]|uniref:NUDIX hydrolase n=1 Tax=Pullulanibacillus sp. KACC 23026 TaxID=3028315 RepID=UPI0023AE7D5E|nr:NUDIX hydrolase [Pullulanibacillus sp. KACC 23026]WEG12840.1 NUDIX hydrolase [Pullulanibacillus sp. KACC 23026]